MLYGTAYFTSHEAAIRYYRPYGYDAASVARKLAEGDIHVGKPSLSLGDRLVIIDDGARYGIETER
jgi:hypothetical protein